MQSTEQASAIPARRLGPPRPVILTVLRGPNAGARFVIDGDVTEIGCTPSADIMLDDITVTRRHARLLRTETGYKIADLGSLNGTYVNQERVYLATVKPGDDIQIGKFTLAILG